MGENLYYNRQWGHVVAVRQRVCRYFLSSFLSKWFSYILHSKSKCT